MTPRTCGAIARGPGCRWLPMPLLWVLPLIFPMQTGRDRKNNHDNTSKRHGARVYTWFESPLYSIMAISDGPAPAPFYDMSVTALRGYSRVPRRVNEPTMLHPHFLGALPKLGQTIRTVQRLGLFVAGNIWAPRVASALFPPARDGQGADGARSWNARARTWLPVAARAAAMSIAAYIPNGDPTPPDASDG
jgi:hypothetical protein